MLNFRSIIFKFVNFVFCNFLFIFQFFFVSNFFFSSRIDEEFVVCFAIFFVFLLFINQIVQGVQDVLKVRSEIYLNSFVITLQLIRKALKRFKKHNYKLVIFSISSLSFFENHFVSNLVSYYKHSLAINNYFLNSKVKAVIDSLILLYELNFWLKKEVYQECYNVELKFESFLFNLH